MRDEAWNQRVLEERKERVPICTTQLTIPRCIWDEAWLTYKKKYGGPDHQFYRLLNEGFYDSELDALRPGWRPVAQEIERLRKLGFAHEGSIGRAQ